MPDLVSGIYVFGVRVKEGVDGRVKPVKPGHDDGLSSLRGALATTQSILSFNGAMDCFASLAMTWI
jgi:hypothetical protein